MSIELKVYYDGDSSYAATSVEDATALWEEINGPWDGEHDEAPGDVWAERPLDALQTITFDSSSEFYKANPDGAEIVERFASGEGDTIGGRVRATWRAWAAKTGRGLICSENW